MGIFGSKKTDQQLYNYFSAKFKKGVKCTVIFGDNRNHTLIVKFTNKGIEMGSLSPDITLWEEIREIRPSQENVTEIIIYTRSSGEFRIVTSSSIPNNILSNILNDRVASELADRFCPYCMHNPPVIANYCDECGTELPKWSKAVLTYIKSCFEGIEMNVSVGTTKVVNKTIPETKGHSGLGGALVGGLLLGPVGAVAGASTTRDKHTTYRNVKQSNFEEKVKGTSWVSCNKEGIFIKKLETVLPWKDMVSLKVYSQHNITIEMISGHTFVLDKNVQGINKLFKIYSTDPADEDKMLKLFKSRMKN